VVRADVDEEEEVVSDQLHPVDCLFDGHPLRVEVLRANDDGRVLRLLVILDRHRSRRDGMQDICGCGFDVDSLQRTALLLEMRAARMLAPVDTLLLRTTQLLRHLVDSEIESHELVAVDSLRAYDRPLADESELDSLIGHPPASIGAMRHLHIQSLRFRSERLHPGDLLLDNGAEAIGDTHPDANDACFHCCLLVPVLPAKGGPWSPCEPLP
jgi:hypothetical protein